MKGLNEELIRVSPVAFCLVSEIESIAAYCKSRIIRDKGVPLGQYKVPGPKVARKKFIEKLCVPFSTKGQKDSGILFKVHIKYYSIRGVYCRIKRKCVL